MCLEQAELSDAVHLPLYRLELGDLAIRRMVTDGEGTARHCELRGAAGRLWHSFTPMPDMPVIALPPQVQSRSPRCANPRTKAASPSKLGGWSVNATSHLSIGAVGLPRTSRQPSPQPKSPSMPPPSCSLPEGLLVACPSRNRMYHTEILALLPNVKMVGSIRLTELFIETSR